MKQATTKLIIVGLTSLLVVTGCKKNKKQGVGEYTYNTYLSTKPKTWNVHNWESSDESYVQAFCEMGLYDLAFNEKRDGYVVIHELAGAMPKDVTSSISDEEYDRYGYSGNLDEGFVWEIALNKDAVWENGEAIKAVDYVESMKRQLDPKMVNFRADSYYGSSLVIANAERYFKQGRSTIEPLYNYINKDTGEMPSVVCKDDKYYINIARTTPFANSVFSGSDELSLYTVLNQRSTTSTDAVELAAQRITDGCAYFAWKYCNHEGDYQKDWDEITEYKKLSSVKQEMMNYEMNIDDFDEKEVYARSVKDQSGEEYKERYTTSDLKKDLRLIVSTFGHVSKDWGWKLPLFGSYYNDYAEDFANVGIAAVDEYTIRLYLSQAVSELDLEFSLTGNWLVKCDLYDSLKQVASTGYVTTKYATPGGGVEGYMSYGPYKLTVFESGKEMRMVRNSKWYGWTDGKHEGMYNATGIYTRIIPDHNVAMQEFEAGNIDDIELNRSDMKIYGNSSRKTAAYESYTQKISFNSDFAKLKSRQSSEKGNKTILSNMKFRTGLSLAMDRNNFASQATAGSKAFTGLLNDLYLTEVSHGEMYRNTAQGKSVYGMVYNELGGTSDPFGDDFHPEPLAESENGYNLAMATHYVAEGLKEEAASSADGHLVTNGKIGLEFRVYDTESEATQEMLAFIRTQFNKVIEEANKKLGTSYTIEITAQKDEDYYNSAKSGNYDMIFSTWGGAAVNPIGLMQVYCDSTFESNCEYGFKGKQGSYMVEIDANGDGSIGEGETKSLESWWSEINGITEDAKNYGSEAWTKQHNYILNVLAGLEAAYLKRFEAVPLVARASTSLNSFKIENGSKVYVNLMGYGGLRYLTFNMDDYDWNKFIKSSEYSADLYKN